MSSPISALWFHFTALMARISLISSGIWQFPLPFSISGTWLAHGRHPTKYLLALLWFNCKVQEKLEKLQLQLSDEVSQQSARMPAREPTGLPKREPSANSWLTVLGQQNGRAALGEATAGKIDGTLTVNPTNPWQRAVREFAKFGEQLVSDNSWERLLWLSIFFIFLKGC